MTTDKIMVDNSGSNIERLLEEAAKYAEYHNMPHKNALHLRLLAEETVGLLKELIGNYKAYFYIEGDGKTSTLNVDGEADLDTWQREDLMSVSSTGKNIMAKGIMNKIRAAIEAGSSGLNTANEMEILSYGLYTAPYEYGGEMITYPVWSLTAYKQGIENLDAGNEIKEKAWDELEKSIVANIADDVRVGMLKGKIKLEIIYKNK